MENNNHLHEFIKYNPFEEIKNQIILLCKIICFTNIEDIYYLFFNISKYKLLEDENIEILNLINKVFVPLDFEIIEETKNFNEEII
jgi:hypothetical protein